MLKRFYIYVLLSMLFAVMQIGMAAHEISHLNDLASQSKTDQHSGAEPCTLCLGLSLIAGAMPSTAFSCPVSVNDETGYTFHSPSIVQPSVSIYAARAPPFLSQL
jgi:hypothetical protein